MATVAAPKDKLDTVALAGVNGPEGGSFADWDSIDWDRAQENVRRLRQRIFTASREGDLPKARNLQKLVLRSLSNTLVSVRRVTEAMPDARRPGWRAFARDGGHAVGCHAASVSLEVWCRRCPGKPWPPDPRPR
ncbi:reverse transcriptase N-terminal domain-containing protein [Streptacidiphilus sp. EB103A]|uniref:reverse transcriptase N-terminal domain-containing protein n=1 Tax=Streptacidiphilus sp. EB103A TaxID=3156275 RepID=UPI003518E276